MNCAKCANPRLNGGRPAKTPAKPRLVNLVKVGEFCGEDKFQCPACHAVFFFPMARPAFEQIPLAAMA
jgi:hypothetical protein